MTTRKYLPGFEQSTALLPIDTKRPAGRWTPDTAGGYSTTRAVVVETAPWSAMVALREWAVDRAETVVASGAPDANDYSAVLATDGEGWDVALLAEMIADVVIDDVSAIDDAWSIGPWWSRQHALIETARFATTAPLFPSAPKVIAATAKHAVRKDGTIRSHRQRAHIAIGGAGKRTADGAPLSPAMARFGALLPDTGATADDAWHAAAAMAAQGLIPTALGGEDWVPQEMTPELAGDVLIESQRENVGGARRKVLVGRTRGVLHERDCAIAVERREAKKDGRKPRKVSGPTVALPDVYCSCSPTTRITERVTGPRTLDTRRATMVRGIPVLASDESAPWSRRHIGDAVVVLAPRDDIERTTYVTRKMDKGRKITRYIGGNAKPNSARNAFVVPVRGKSIERTNRAEARAAILAVLATISTEGATASFGAWSIECESAATSRAAARYSATLTGFTKGTGGTVTDTPRGLATQLAAL